MPRDCLEIGFKMLMETAHACVQAGAGLGTPASDTLAVSPSNC